MLIHLGVIAPGQAIAAADLATVGAEIDAACARLQAYRDAPFETSAIPDWAQGQLRDIVANACAPAYVSNPARIADLKQRAKDAEADLDHQRTVRAGGV